MGALAKILGKEIEGVRLTIFVDALYRNASGIGIDIGGDRKSADKRRAVLAKTNGRKPASILGSHPAFHDKIAHGNAGLEREEIPVHPDGTPDSLAAQGLVCLGESSFPVDRCAIGNDGGNIRIGGVGNIVFGLLPHRTVVKGSFVKNRPLGIFRYFD